MVSLDILKRNILKEMEEGNIEEADRLAKKVLRNRQELTDEEIVSLLNIRIDIAITQKKLDKAYRLIKEAEKIIPENVDTLYYEGFLFGIKGNFKRAADIFYDLVLFSPRNAEYLRCYGWNIYNMGYTNRGKKFLKYALTMNPSHPYAISDLAIAHVNEFEFDKAEKLVNAAIRKNPQLRYQLSALLNSIREFKRLASDYDDIDDIQLDDKGQLKKARIYMMVKQKIDKNFKDTISKEMLDKIHNVWHEIANGLKDILTSVKDPDVWIAVLEIWLRMQKEKVNWESIEEFKKQMEIISEVSQKYNLDKNEVGRMFNLSMAIIKGSFTRKI